jgi:malonate decarboxylase beta subunit
MEQIRMNSIRHDSFYEARARVRVAHLLDPNSFIEFLPPSERVISPHLKQLNLPVAFDDGMVVGRGLLAGKKVLCAAQEPGFMGGSVGEVHGAKFTGLLELASDEKPSAVILILDTGGVRLHEANAGLIAISEIQRALFKARNSGVTVIAVSAGSNGIYGGISIVARCCDYVLITEEGRLSVSGPEVIEAQKGVEEFDARDRALVWRTMGGKHRYLINEAQSFAEDSFKSIRDHLISLLNHPIPINLDQLEAEHRELGQRLNQFGTCTEAFDIWKILGITEPEKISSLDYSEFMSIANRVRTHG